MNQGPFQGTHILVVDDSALIRAALRKVLHELGAATSEAADGQAALQVARAHPPTLILADVNMPLVDGLELCRQIRADARLKLLPVVLLSSLDSPRDVMTGMRAGATDYLSKNQGTRASVEAVLGRALLKGPAFGAASSPLEAGPPPVGAPPAFGLAPPRAAAPETAASNLPGAEVSPFSRHGVRLTSSQDVRLDMLQHASTGLMVFNLQQDLICLNQRAARALRLPDSTRPAEVPFAVRDEVLGHGVSAYEAGMFNMSDFVTCRMASGAEFRYRIELLQLSTFEATGVLFLIR